jgi:hypothetical protein
VAGSLPGRVTTPPTVTPVYHWLEERIRAHVLLCWLALLLVRVAENQAGQTWPAMRRQGGSVPLSQPSQSQGSVVFGSTAVQPCLTSVLGHLVRGSAAVLCGGPSGARGPVLLHSGYGFFFAHCCHVGFAEANLR